MSKSRNVPSAVDEGSKDVIGCLVADIEEGDFRLRLLADKVLDRLGHMGRIGNTPRFLTLDKFRDLHPEGVHLRRDLIEAQALTRLKVGDSPSGTDLSKSATGMYPLAVPLSSFPSPTICEHLFPRGSAVVSLALS